jgi:hypothetical protein
MQDDPESVLNRYHLSPRDRRRLINLVQQRGMSVNCTLYRFNRITPLYTLLPLTAFVLGDEFIHEAEAFWGHTDSDPRFRQKLDRFGEFLIERIRQGKIESPLVNEVLTFELATNELRFAQRREILDELKSSSESTTISRRVRLHPLTRLVPFRREPATLLRFLKERRPLPYKLVEGDFWLLLDVLDDELRVRKIDPRLGLVLNAISADDNYLLPDGDVGALLEAGMVVRRRASALEQ